MSDASKPFWSTPEITTLRSARQANSGDDTFEVERQGTITSAPSAPV